MSPELQQLIPSLEDIPYLSKVWGRYRNLNVLYKLGIGAAIVFLVIASMGAVTVVQTEGILEGQTSGELKQFSGAQSTQVQSWMSNTERETQYLSEFLSDSENRDAELESRVSNLPEELSSIHIINGETGGVETTTNDAYRGTDSSDTSLPDIDYENIGTVDAGQVGWVGPYESSSTESMALAFYTPLPNENSVLVLEANLNEASNMLNTPANGRTIVTNREGTVVMSSVPNTIGENSNTLGITNEDVFDLANQENSVTFQTNQFTDTVTYNGNEQVTGITSLDQTGHIVVSQAPTSSAYYLQRTITDQVAILIIVSLATIAAVLGIIGRDILQSISRLREYGTEVADGNYNPEVTELSREDEFGDLFDTVQTMSSSLESEIRETRNRNQELETVVEQQQSVMKDVSEGDLTVRMDTETEVGQLSNLASQFNEMMDDFQRSIEEAIEFGEEVTAASEQATAGTEEIHQASKQVTDSVQEISSGVENQNNHLDGIATGMAELAETNATVSESANELVERAEVTEERSSEGQEAAQNASEVLEDIESKTGDASETMQDLTEDMDEIGEIVEFISEMAEETNMLALNASIEASRAGKDGDGFAVVAERVKNLADKVTDAADDIEHSLGDLQSKTEQTAEDITEAQKTVDRGSETIEEALHALEDINGKVSGTTRSAKQIDVATDEQKTSTDQIEDMVDEVASISGQTVEQASSVSAAAEEQSSSTHQINTSVQTLDERATNLSELLGHFDVGDVDVDTGDMGGINTDLQDSGFLDEDSDTGLETEDDGNDEDTNNDE